MPTSKRVILVLSGLLFLIGCKSEFRMDAEEELLDLLEQEARPTVVPAELFERLGWELPDNGDRAQQLADSASGGAFDPRLLEAIPSAELGYQARWRVVRFERYGLQWDITGLELTPVRPSTLPLLTFINGGSANWYEFYLDPLNRPGLGQYLAQRMPVLLITIPGNYKPGGWNEPFEQRKPAYLQDQELSDSETAVRNAIFTFSLICQGVEQLIRETTDGPVLIAGHSTGGEIQFLLKERLKDRLRGLSLGWGTGGPAILRKEWEEKRGSDARQYPPIDRVRGRSPEGYTNNYIGPLNPLPGKTRLEVAQAWFQKEHRRRPQFKQPLQDIEHRGEVQLREEVERQLRTLLADNAFGVDADEVIADLFSTMRTELSGYRRMISNTGPLDQGHWNSDPDLAREMFLARHFEKHNPEADLRVVVFETPMTHYGHIEKPKQLAGALLTAVRWVIAAP